MITTSLSGMDAPDPSWYLGSYDAAIQEAVGLIIQRSTGPEVGVTS
jgi:hypothetical protein